MSVVSVPTASTLLVADTLSREQAGLAVTGLMPQAHGDVVDHWLDQQYPRKRAFRPLAIVAAIAMCLGGPIVLGQHPQRRRVTVAQVNITQPVRPAGFTLAA